MTQEGQTQDEAEVGRGGKAQKELRAHGARSQGEGAWLPPGCVSAQGRALAVFASWKRFLEVSSWKLHASGVSMKSDFSANEDPREE